MKKKNGFIATSLIYTFFLAFITLFLGVVADYLQQKVLLNSIEEGIKKEMNSRITLSDLEGQIIYVLNNCNDTPTDSDKITDTTSLTNSVIHKCFDNSDQKCTDTNSICIIAEDR